MTKLYMQHLHSSFWFLTSYKRRLSNKSAPPSYERLTSKFSFYYELVNYLTVTLYLTFDSTSIPLLKMARHNNIKIYNIFYQKNCKFYLPPFQSTFDGILLSRYYIAIGGTNMNYAKNFFLLSCVLFHKENLII